MKKFRGTKYAYIGTSYNPTLEAQIDHLAMLVQNQQVRLGDLSVRIQRLLGLDPEQEP